MCSRQLAHDQFIGVVDHFFKLTVRYRAVQFHGVPMAFVLVVAGADRRVPGPQIHRNVGVAFEVDAARVPVQRHQREHPTTDLEYGDTIPERIVLHRRGKTSAQFEDLRSIQLAGFA